MSGRMPDGLAPGVGASIRRAPPAIEESDQTYLARASKMAGAVALLSPHPDARVGVQSRPGGRTQGPVFLIL
jgi:hypothetical protein